MKRKREFGDGIIFTISNYIWWFLLVNFYFWILNIPLIIVTLSMAISGDYGLNLLLILALLPLGPALTALFSIMGKLTREGDINVTKDFFKAYKENFFESMFFWTIELVIILILWTEIKFINGNSSLYYLGIIPRIMLFVCITLTFYIFPILSRFYLKRKDVFRLSVLYLFKKIYFGIFYIVSIFVIWLTLSKISGATIILLFVSIMGYLVMYLEKGMLQEIEETIEENDNFAE
jgi:uncharacterized membrane protein YesL